VKSWGTKPEHAPDHVHTEPCWEEEQRVRAESNVDPPPHTHTHTSTTIVKSFCRIAHDLRSVSKHTKPKPKQIDVMREYYHGCTQETACADSKLHQRSVYPSTNDQSKENRKQKEKNSRNQTQARQTPQKKEVHL
jgi:hypothetical protein